MRRRAAFTAGIVAGWLVAGPAVLAQEQHPSGNAGPSAATSDNASAQVPPARGDDNLGVASRKDGAPGPGSGAKGAGSTPFQKLGTAPGGAQR